ncbi:MAG: redox-regulated ATPase YchF [Chloroflexi bacterium]|nr:redox-regulated ATPase YchF [Chloroflexota bacterium]
MRLGIIGLPQSGKTTIFNALTRGDRPVGTMAGGGRFEVHTGVVNVPDRRVDKLSAMFDPRKTIYAQVTYADIAGVEAGAGRSGFSGPLLNQLTQMDGFLHVARVFDDPKVPHVAGSVDAARDVATIDTEFLLNDMLAVERKLERLAQEAKGGKVKDKALAQHEEALFTKLRDTLAAETPLRDIELTAAEEQLLRGYGLLTRKPVILVLNIGEKQEDPDAILKYPHRTSVVVALQGHLEMEIAQLSSEDAAAFLAEYGIAEAGLSRVIRLSYDLLGLESFFTVGEDEVRAWTVRRGAFAPQAAGEIHTDMEHGFIRAEIVSYDDLIECGGLSQARSKGKLRLEGKEYVVKDGDILNIRFSPPANR